jgi:hypothetical protein
LGTLFRIRTVIGGERQVGVSSTARPMEANLLP